MQSTEKRRILPRLTAPLPASRLVSSRTTGLLREEYNNEILVSYSEKRLSWRLHKTNEPILKMINKSGYGSFLTDLTFASFILAVKRKRKVRIKERRQCTRLLPILNVAQRYDKEKKCRINKQQTFDTLRFARWCHLPPGTSPRALPLPAETDGFRRIQKRRMSISDACNLAPTLGTQGA